MIHFATNPKTMNKQQKTKLIVDSFSTMTREPIMTRQELHEKINGLFTLTEKMFIRV